MMKRNVVLMLVLLTGLLFAAGYGCSDKTEEATVASNDGPVYGVPAEQAASVQAVGFDIDDTLLFSTPAFTAAQEEHRFGTDECWAAINGLDREVSVVKKKTAEIVAYWQEQGAEIYAITGRPDINGDPLREFIAESFDIPADHVYFEPDGKTERMRDLSLDVFYGDANTDITDAQGTGILGVRIQRSPNSSYRNRDGSLRKYDPGEYGEPIIEDSEE